MNWVKHYIWFLRMSREFLECSLLKVILKGGLWKALQHANTMVKHDKFVKIHEYEE